MTRRNRCLKCDDPYHINGSCPISSATGRASINKRWKGTTKEQRQQELKPIKKAFDSSFKSEKERKNYFANLGKLSGLKKRERKLGAIE